MNVLEEDKEDIALANFIENLQKQTDEENFPKNELNDCGIVTKWKEKLRRSFLK